MNGPDLQPRQAATLRDHLQTRRNAVGLALMLAGIVPFIIFHFVSNQGHHGWEVWPNIVKALLSGNVLRRTGSLLGVSGFITLAIVTLASPCLTIWILQNRWIKWCLAAFAGMTAGIMWFISARGGPHLNIVILALAPTLTLAGLLCIMTVPRQLPPTGRPR